MHRTFFVFLKCTIQGESKVDVLDCFFTFMAENFARVLTNTGSFR